MRAATDTDRVPQTDIAYALSIIRMSKITGLMNPPYTQFTGREKAYRQFLPCFHGYTGCD
jgi:hypothetical protein